MKKVKKIIKKYNPRSIFLYGSRARGDNFPDSDWEIGVFNEELHSSMKGVFFFSYSEFKKGEIDTPFPIDIYLRELSLSGKTLYGEKVIENFTPPPIRSISILERINFDCGISLAAYKYKNKEFFYKSLLFGLRNLIILEKKEFPLTYKQIFKSSMDLDLGKFNKLPEKAYKIRKKNKKPTGKDYKYNICFINNFIRKRIKSFYEKKGDKTIIQ